jgi:crotonobetainyl-CoA:carnitine CoA-transferase CaiB-like acyl-CoA transferase
METATSPAGGARGDGAEDLREARAAAHEVAAAVGLDFADEQLKLRGRDAVLPVRYPLGVAAAGVFGACGVALARLARSRDAAEQVVGVEIDHAALALVSFRQLRLEGQAIGSPGDANPLVGIYRCADGRWIAIHGGFPSLQAPTLRVLGASNDAASIAAAIEQRDSAELEEALAGARQCGVVCRTAVEWRDTEAGQALAAAPLVEIERIGDAPPRPLAPAAQPLAGVRVLDFTRILAGPTCGRFLAAGGADVLAAGCRRLPNVDSYALETSHGKRFVEIDLDHAEGRGLALQLAAGADVFVDSYRSGALARHGLGFEALAQRSPGLIHVAINCYGHRGPWIERPGWELMGQAATGLAVGHGAPDAPRPLWSYPCDYLTGFLAGLGVLQALRQRAEQGGSWQVRVSLARTGMYAEAFGARHDPPPAARDVAERYCRTAATPLGALRYLPLPIELPATPLRWSRLVPGQAVDAPKWLPR